MKYECLEKIFCCRIFQEKKKLCKSFEKFVNFSFLIQRGRGFVFKTLSLIFICFIHFLAIQRERLIINYVSHTFLSLDDIKKKRTQKKYGGTSESIPIFREAKMVGGADQ